jgi:hypothetical protein
MKVQTLWTVSKINYPVIYSNVVKKSFYTHVMYFPNLELHDKKVKYLYEATEEMCCYQETQYTDTYDVSIIKIQLQFRTVHR